jgi:transposase
MAYSREVQIRFIELSAEGLSLDEIVKKIKISKPTLIKWKHEFWKEITELNEIIIKEVEAEANILLSQRLCHLHKKLEEAYEILSKRNYKELKEKELFTVIDNYERLLIDLLPKRNNKNNVRLKVNDIHNDQ